MTLRRWVAFLALGALVVGPGAASADDVQEQLRAMQERLLSLEDKLQATSEQLDAANQRVEAQQEMIERAGISEGSAASSGLAAFLETLEIGGFVAASYNWNFEDPDGGDLGGFNGGAVPAYPFHPDPNSFSLDQFWLELERPVSEEHRAGFRVDLVYGKTAELLNANEAINPDGFSGSDEDFELYQAYIQYLAPIGSGVTFQAGKFGTLIGAEVAASPYNLNITRGHVYNLFQPITHVGFLASTDLAEGWSGTLGLVNETRCFPGCDIDLNKDKALLGALGWSGENVSVSLAGTFGASDSGQGADTKADDKETIIDLIIGWDPSENLSTYVNLDWISSQNDLPTPVGTLTGELDGWGIAAAGRYALSERMGLALRAEWVDLNFDTQGASDGDQRIWGLTGTVDYLLTANLKVRGELRYDNLTSSDTGFRNAFFRSSSTLDTAVGDEDDQMVALVEAIYSFNGF